MVREKLDLRESLIGEARRLLGEGSSEISLRSVAKGVGVSAMAPYRHFEDKAALLGAVSDQGFLELRTALSAADARADGADALVEQGLAYIAFAKANPSLFRLMFAGQETACRPKPEGATAFDVLASRVAAIAPDRSEVGTLACWATVHGLATLALDGRIDAEPDPVRAVLTLLAQSIARP